MVERWYVETRALGGWVPSIYFGDKPIRVLLERKGMPMRFDPILIPPEMDDLPLGVIARILGPDGDMRDMPREDLAAFLRNPTASVLYWRKWETRH